MASVIEEDVVRSEILDGLTQVDDSFVIDEFNCEFNALDRTLTIDFTASNESGHTVNIKEVLE